MVYNYKPELGFLTKTIRNEYLFEELKLNKISIEDIPDALSLYASGDKNKRIYFWQLYNILGEKPIIYLITKFYKNIFNDEAEWFRDEFTDLGSIEYHVKGQSNFWLDIMGGGQRYIGGEKLLNKKHKLVENIMTREGAEKWMDNMEKTLKEITLTKDFEDKRIIVCIYDFLEYFMNKYAVEFDFNVFNMDILKKKIFIKSKY